MNVTPKKIQIFTPILASADDLIFLFKSQSMYSGDNSFLMEWFPTKVLLILHLWMTSKTPSASPPSGTIHI